MTRTIKYSGILSALLLIYACFIPWVNIVSKGIMVSGVDSTGTNFGKPGYFHFIMVIFFLAFTLIPRVWAKRFNLLVTALNVGWGIRNFLIIGMCEAGECPVKKLGIYLVLFSSIMMLVSSLFPDLRLKEEPSSK